MLRGRYFNLYMPRKMKHATHEQYQIGYVLPNTPTMVPV